MAENYPLKYAFILGNSPELSQAEIFKVLQAQGFKFEEILYTKEVLLIGTEQKLDAQIWQKRLGGTIKIVLITNQAVRGQLEKNIQELIMAASAGALGKFQFGFSLYGEMDVAEFQKIGLTLKRKLKENGTNSRFVVSKDKSLSSVIVKKENLIGAGLDLVIIRDQQNYYLGQTLSVQDFNDYSFRDFGRPDRDDKSGMLPPKVAKMMINLASPKSADVILDPFCGSGTVLQEALLMGFSNLIGSDISEKAVADSQNNINWLKTKYQLDIARVKIHLLDARRLDKIKDNSVDLIVTEPFLGETTFAKQKNQDLDELAALYLNSLKEFTRVLKAGGRVVMILPIINGENMDILPEVAELGFVIEKLSKNNRGSVVYGRENARVEREIFVFVKNDEFKSS